MNPNNPDATPTPDPIPEPTPDKTPAKGWWLGRFFKAITPNHPTLVILFVAIVCTSLFLTFRNAFLHHVPSGHTMILIAKFGEPLAEGQVLAGPGQKGIREEVYGEGWHFVWPILYEVEIKPTTVVPGARVVEGKVRPPQVGILKALGGKPMPAGRFLAEEGEQGIRRQVLLPGSYRLNPYGYEVRLQNMVEVTQGHVGVKIRKLGDDGTTEFATKPTEKGILRDEVLQPGLYPINTEEYAVILCDVGIYQTTYHYVKDKDRNSKDNPMALVFDASDSNRIELDCTIEWELKPQFWPLWVAKFRNKQRIEDAVIKLNVKNISRNKGQDYGAEDFLNGIKREQFQADFTEELLAACKEDNVVIRHAFIRNIIIPDQFLKPKREEQLAREKGITQKEQTRTAETQNDVVAAQKTVDLEVAKVKATTEKLVGAIDREATNVGVVTKATLEKMKDEFDAKLAILKSERDEQLGKAKAEAERLKNTAKSGLYKMQMDIFKQDSESFLRYTMSQKLPEDMRLRLFQSGPGTFWTNLGDKAMNLFMPAGR